MLTSFNKQTTPPCDKNHFDQFLAKTVTSKNGQILLKANYIFHLISQQNKELKSGSKKFNL